LQTAKPQFCVPLSDGAKRETKVGSSALLIGVNLCDDRLTF
jgi:hypothetical protein